MRNLNASVVPESLQKQVESLYKQRRNYYRYMGGYELRDTYDMIVRIYESYRSLRHVSPSEPEWPELRELKRKLEREIRARRQINHARDKHDAEYRTFREIQQALR